MFQERYGIAPAYLPIQHLPALEYGRIDPARPCGGAQPAWAADGRSGRRNLRLSPCKQGAGGMRLGAGHAARLGHPRQPALRRCAEPIPAEAADLRSLVARLGLAAHVRFVGSDFVPEQTYQDYLVGADLGIQLRTYGLGGLSGAVLDCAAAGLPTVTNASLGDAVGVPAAYFRSIPDALSPVLLAEALADLLEAGLPAQRPEAERRALFAKPQLSTSMPGCCAMR